MTIAEHPVTPDGRYLVINGRLWRRSNPSLPPEVAQALVSELMDARRKLARKDLSAPARADARARVDVAKRKLGERGEVWWDDGAPDLNRKLVQNPPYAGWFSDLSRP